MPQHNILSEKEVTQRLAETRKCETCGKLFAAWRTRRGKGGCVSIVKKQNPHCSISCGRRGKALLPKEELDKRLSDTKECLHCGKPFNPWKFREGNGSTKTNQMFCSQSCAQKRYSKEEVTQRLSETRPCRNCLKPIVSWKLCGKWWYHVEFCSNSCAMLFKTNNKFLYPWRTRKDGRTLTAFGETKTFVEWSRDTRCKIGLSCLQGRINQYKWSPEAAITTPSRKSRISDSERERGEAFKQTLRTMLSQSPLFQPV